MQTKETITATILIADDDADDRLMTKEAFEENFTVKDLQFVENGQELLDYLHKIGKYENSNKPGLILLDLNMPKMDGREALKAIKADADLKRIPVVILTTSKAEEDILRTYDLGVNCFITKPVTYTGLVKVAKALGRYWFQIVELPPEKK